MKDKPTIPLERARSVADQIITHLTPWCKRIEVAGSVRRRRPYVHDIDIVLQASDPWTLRAEIVRLGILQKKGEAIMSVMVGLIPVDFYFANDDTWATHMLIRTGPAGHNIELAKLARSKGMILHADGRGLYRLETIATDAAADAARETRIVCDNEVAIFHKLGLMYEEPWERDHAGKCKRIVTTA